MSSRTGSGNSSGAGPKASLPYQVVPFLVAVIRDDLRGVRGVAHRTKVVMGLSGGLEQYPFTHWC